jgi:predicted Zn finger-like uncharacterized protein
VNLATRCPRCATTFRVQDAQLAASDGHVRCGRCDTVFDARLSLFDLDTGEALQASPPVGPPLAEVPFDTADSDPQWPATDPQRALAAPGQADFSPTVANADVAPPPAAADAAQRHEPGWDDTRCEPDPRSLEPDWEPADPAPVHTPAPTPSAAPSPASTADINQRMQAMLGAPEGSPSTAAMADTPGGAGNLDAWRSLRDADAPTSPAAKWQRGGAWLLIALLALALPLQWAWVERAALRAKSPALDALMLRLCPSCANAPWQHLEGLSVDASSLQPTPQGGAYQVSLTLRNRAAHTLALPWVELRLTDGNGRAVLRRAIRPSELGAASDRVSGGGSAQLSGTFKLPPQSSVSGYEISLFHP